MAGLRSVAFPRPDVRFTIHFGNLFLKWQGARNFMFGHGDGHCENPEDRARWAFHYCPGYYHDVGLTLGFDVPPRDWCVIRHGYFAPGREGWTRKLSLRLAAEIGERHGWKAEQDAFQAA